MSGQPVYRLGVGIAPRQRRALGLAAVLGGVALARLPKRGNAFVWDDLSA
jgi:hypothetical protein